MRFVPATRRIKAITGPITGHQFDIRAIRTMDDDSGIGTVRITVCDKGGNIINEEVYKEMNESEYNRIQPDSDSMDLIIDELMKELKL